MNDYNNELIHYGVPGMKWGVRKDRKSSSSTSKKQRRKKQREENKKIKKQVKAVKKERRTASKRRFILSDEDLDKRIDRLSREKKLRELTESEVLPGRSFITRNAKKNIEIAIEGGTRKVTKMPKKK